MEVFYISDLLELPKLEENSCCVGVFDGIHNGHRELIKRIREFKTKSLLITFDDRKKTNYSLMTTNQKNGLIELLGVDYLIVFPYQTIKNVRYIEFIEILKKLSVSNIVCGEDFRFGFNREGNVDHLKKHFNVIVLDYSKLSSTRTSSSLIKQLISIGEIEEANKHLGMPYTMCCEIIGRSKIIDKDVIELSYFEYLLPPAGTYNVAVEYDNKSINCNLELFTEDKKMYIYLKDNIYTNKDIKILFINKI